MRSLSIGVFKRLNVITKLVYDDRFAESSMDGKGYDRVRRVEIGKKNFKLTHFEEVCGGVNSRCNC